jgi:hypothetical protein
MTKGNAWVLVKIYEIGRQHLRHVSLYQKLSPTQVIEPFCGCGTIYRVRTLYGKVGGKALALHKEVGALLFTMNRKDRADWLIPVLVFTLRRVGSDRSTR